MDIPKCSCMVSIQPMATVGTYLEMVGHNWSTLPMGLSDQVSVGKETTHFCWVPISVTFTLNTELERK